MKNLFVTNDISGTLTQTMDKPAELNAKIVSQMHAGVAHFFYKKKDGTTREAFGTLNKELLETLLGSQNDSAQTEPVPNSEQVYQNYFDLTAKNKKGGVGEFRRYDLANLVAMF